MNETSFAKMTTVAEQPAYSHMVRELKIFPRLLTKFYYRDGYERELRTRLRRIEVNGVRTSYTLSAEELDNAYDRYNEIWMGETGLLGNVETELLNAMDCLPQLHSVTSGGWQDFVQSESRWVPMTGKDIQLETTLMLPGLSWARLNYRNEGLHSSTVTKSIIRAIASSRPVLSGVLREAGIFKSFAIDYRKLSARDLRLVKRLVNCLICFDLPIPKNYNKKPYDPVIFTEVLRWCSLNLEKLSITDSRSSPHPLWPPNTTGILEHIFGDIRWSRLSSLSLDGFIVDGDSLITVFQHHKSTLTKLCLLRIKVKFASWQQIFTELQGGALTVIDFQDLYVGETEHKALGRASDDDGSWDVLQKGLHSFIVDGQPWPSDILSANLSQDDRQLDDTD